MHDHQKLHRARIVASVAATVIALACGTNYGYSAWAPQFADKLLLSATESNLIGLAGNLGMYLLGVPIGMFIDHKGPRPAVICGSILLGLGYFPIRQAYLAGSGSLTLLCLFSFLTGLGGCMAFGASIKTSAVNWPHHRGTATAFPLAAFGLSAFFFSIFGSLVAPGDTAGFLLILAVGTFGLTFVSFFFLHVLPHPHLPVYHPVAHRASDVGGGDSGGGGLSDSQQLRRTLSTEAKAKRAAAAVRASKAGGVVEEPGRSSSSSLLAHGEHEIAEPSDTTPNFSNAPPPPKAAAEEGEERETEIEAQAGPSTPVNYESISASRSPVHSHSHSPSPFGPAATRAEDADHETMDETSSLMSRTSSSASSMPGEVLVQNSVDMDRSHRIDIRGWQLLKNIEFWQMFSIMAILAGVGLMTINNIGHNAHALWKRYDDSVSDKFLVHRQQMHVSILSIGSFIGRLLSGAGSDFLVKKLHASRVWCLMLAAVVFVVAQVLALNITNPHFLFLVSSLSGLGYGFLFGVFPSIVAEAFGIHGLSQNWGFMTLSPVISGNIFNLFYGSVLDHHSIVLPSGERQCSDGLDCYRAAYVVTLGACGIGLVVTLLVIRHQYLQKLKEEGKRGLED